MKKKIISALVLAVLAVQLTGCGGVNITEKGDESSTFKGFSVETGSGGGVSAATVTVPEITSASETAEAASGSQSDEVIYGGGSAAETVPPEDTGNNSGTIEWNETEASGERYVNTDYIYSRISAVQGSEKVKQYRLNDKVTVTAVTDTDYYKLSDGTFIHTDYLSKDKINDSTAEEKPENSPQWIETPASGERYVNTNNIYSRISAVQGSEKVKQYRLNDKVTETAKTDTDYYKLSDGTFIHADYLSENEIIYSMELSDYSSVTKNGYVIERLNGITYVDGIMIANKTYTLPAGYDPGVQPEAADALAEMQAAAAKEGLSLYVVSGYRSYRSQETIYAGWANRDGTEKADTYSSRAGHSDHQTGYTFDLNSLEQSFAYTPEGIWLAEHCAEYGFIIRYPEGKEMYTGYIYEPWHVRYVGREKAKLITESGLSLEEYYGISSDYAESVQG